jgi:hypothetical protein
LVVEASVVRLHELALTIPRPGCEWEERPRFDPPAPPETIAAFEQNVGFPLSADFRAFLSLNSGVVAMSVHNGYWLGGVERLQVTDFPQMAARERVAPVATDGGGNAFLLSECGRVFLWNHETGNFSHVAGSFSSFLELVVADWAAYIADTPGWRFLV